MARPVARLTKDLTAALRGGHPWVFDRAVALPAGAQPGDLAALRRGRDVIAVGWVDPGAPIAFRVLALGGGEEPGSGDWCRAAARRAGAMRAADPRLGASDGIRLIHGEGDGLSGLVIDLYAGWAAVSFDGAGARRFWRPRIRAVLDGLEAAGHAILGALEVRQGRRGGGGGEPLAGDPVPELVVMQENGAGFEVDLRRGQKTGFFLDQRDNRQVGRELAAGADLLNLFGYTGGFSVHAALGGARRVTTVDIAAPAIEAARRNMERNGIAPGGHRFAAEDAHAFLERAAGAGDRWDVVICDPPSFAPSERARRKGLEAYRALNRAAIDRVVAGGWLLTASCSSHVTEADLIELVGRAARSAGRELRLREVRGAATDHPVRPGFPEGRYLTMLVCYLP